MKLLFKFILLYLAQLKLKSICVRCNFYHKNNKQSTISDSLVDNKHSKISYATPVNDSPSKKNKYYLTEQYSSKSNMDDDFEEKNSFLADKKYFSEGNQIYDLNISHPDLEKKDGPVDIIKNLIKMEISKNASPYSFLKNDIKTNGINLTSDYLLNGNYYHPLRGLNFFSKDQFYNPVHSIGFDNNLNLSKEPKEYTGKNFGEYNFFHPNNHLLSLFPTYASRELGYKQDLNHFIDDVLVNDLNFDKKYGNLRNGKNDSLLKNYFYLHYPEKKIISNNYNLKNKAEPDNTQSNLVSLYKDYFKVYHNLIGSLNSTDVSYFDTEKYNGKNIHDLKEKVKENDFENNLNGKHFSNLHTNLESLGTNYACPHDVSLYKDFESCKFTDIH